MMRIGDKCDNKPTQSSKEEYLIVQPDKNIDEKQKKNNKLLAFEIKFQIYSIYAKRL
jgi:hypothetical protein